MIASVIAANVKVLCAVWDLMYYTFNLAPKMIKVINANFTTSAHIAQSTCYKLVRIYSTELNLKDKPFFFSFLERWQKILCGTNGDSLVRYAKKYVGSNPTIVSKNKKIWIKKLKMAKNLFNAFRKVKIENTLYAGGKTEYSQMNERELKETVLICVDNMINYSTINCCEFQNRNFLEKVKIIIENNEIN